MLLVDLLFVDRVSSILGKGMFGTVVHAVNKITDAVVAIKVLHKQDCQSDGIHPEEKAFHTLVGGYSPHLRFVWHYLHHALELIVIPDCLQNCLVQEDTTVITASCSNAARRH